MKICPVVDYVALETHRKDHSHRVMISTPFHNQDQLQVGHLSVTDNKGEAVGGYPTTFGSSKYKLHLVRGEIKTKYSLIPGERVGVRNRVHKCIM